MDPDLAMSVGLVMGVLSIPALFSAFAERRAPRFAALAIVASASLILWALSTRPGGYSFGELPHVLVRVLARFLT